MILMALMNCTWLRPDSRSSQTLLTSVFVVADCCRLLISRPMKSWLWPYPEVWNWTPRGPAGTPSSAPAGTARRPTRPAAPRTQSLPRVTHTLSLSNLSECVIFPPICVSLTSHISSLQYPTTTISQWLEIKSPSSSSWTLTSPPPSPGTATSASPTG